ncbi:MAG: hypothetical protein ACLTSL_09155 [Odoribacter splanchnicus]
MYSYHIFYFPFKWDILSKEKSSSFSERIDLDHIRINEYSQWERVYDNQKETDYLLYNEKNYFYSFVHPVLYDTGKTGTVMQHFERKEIKEGNVKYLIKVTAGRKIDTYELKIEDLVMNLYSTGVGILVFYLINDKYTDPEDVLRINQYGRRIFPPFLAVNNSLDGPKDVELADYLSIVGLKGAASRYYEDFSWYDCPGKAWDPAKFIQSLVLDLTEDFVMIPYEGKRDPSVLQSEKLRKGIVPAVDDRMFVVSLILDEKLTQNFSTNPKWCLDGNNLFWSRYVFVDAADSCIQNKEMRDRKTAEHTYFRWQECGTLYGYCRYSLVCISSGSFGQNILQPQLKTMYSRMVELSLVQRASILKFSGEVTRLSNLQEKDPHLADKIRDLYREYIRFVNQVYFREVTAQEQGIDLYQALQKQIGLKDQVACLDNEIEELHQYATLLEERGQNQQLNLVTKIGGMFLIPSLLVGYFGMNIFKFDIAEFRWRFPVYFLIGMFVSSAILYFLLFLCKKKIWRIWGWCMVILIVLAMLCMTKYIIFEN